MNLAARVDRNLLGQVALGDRRGYFGDVPHLVGQVAAPGVDVVGQVLPYARHVADLALPAQLAVGADLLGDAGDFGGERSGADRPSC